MTVLAYEVSMHEYFGQSAVGHAAGMTKPPKPLASIEPS